MTPPEQGGNALASKPPEVTETDPQATVQIPQSVLAAAIVSADRALTSYWQEEQRHGLSTVIEELEEWSDGTLDGGRVAQAHAAFTLGELILQYAGKPRGARLTRFVAAFRSTSIGELVRCCADGLAETEAPELRP
jgi:hypothetical protein